jgi:hypothetical protein
MRIVLAYYFRWFKTAIDLHSWGFVDLAVGLVGLTLLAIDFFWPELALGGRTTKIILVTAAIMVVLHLLSAPYRMAHEDAAKIARLEKALDDKEAKLNALRELWGLRRNGVILRNEEVMQIETDREPAWYREYEAWRLAVLVQAGIISVNLENWLETLNEVGAPRAGEMGTRANATLWASA